MLHPFSPAESLIVVPLTIMNTLVQIDKCLILCSNNISFSSLTIFRCNNWWNFKTIVEKVLNVKQNKSPYDLKSMQTLQT